MLEDFLGEDVFRRGLKDYINKHKYSNAVTDDLWDAFEKVSNQPVKELMNSWIRQMGYPIVESNISGSKVILKQKRFLLENSKDAKGKWMIPVSIRTPEKFSSKILSESSIDFILENPRGWYKINYGQKGFYRVKYDSESLENLKDVIETKKLGNVDRYGIQNDFFALCVSGYASVKDYMNFVKSYFEDDDYLVSIDIADNLYVTYLISSGESFSKKLAEFNKKYFRKILGRLGWDPKPDEKHTNALLRGFVISVLGRLGDEGVLKESLKRFDDFLRFPESLNPDLRSAVYSLVAWKGGSETYETLLGLYRKAATQEERIRFQAALSGFQEEKLLNDSLKFSLSDEVKLQDLYVNILKVAGNPFGRKLVWPWIKQNWKEIGKRFGGTGNPLLNRIISVIAVLADAEKENEIAQFFNKNPIPGTEMKIAQTLERLRINSKFVKKMREEFSAK
jgi:tricorn protease interacting factor F2/3